MLVKKQRWSTVFKQTKNNTKIVLLTFNPGLMFKLREKEKQTVSDQKSFSIANFDCFEEPCLSTDSEISLNKRQEITLPFSSIPFAR